MKIRYFTHESLAIREVPLPLDKRSRKTPFEEHILEIDDETWNHPAMLRSGLAQRHPGRTIGTIKRLV